MPAHAAMDQDPFDDPIRAALDAGNYPEAARLIADLLKREPGDYELGPAWYLTEKLGHDLEALDRELEKHDLCIDYDRGTPACYAYVSRDLTRARVDAALAAVRSRGQEHAERDRLGISSAELPVVASMDASPVLAALGAPACVACGETDPDELRARDPIVGGHVCVSCTHADGDEIERAQDHWLAVDSRNRA